MPDTITTRRSLIATAAAATPLVLLGGCGSGAGSVSTLLDTLTGQKPASAQTEVDVWKGAVGQSFRIGTDQGPVYASLTSVTELPAGAGRPADLRQQPLSLSFTLDAGYDAAGDRTYFLDRTMADQSTLFMQRGTTANGRPELVALLN